MRGRALLIGRPTEVWSVFTRQVQTIVGDVVPADRGAAGLKILDGDKDIDLIFVYAESGDSEAIRFLQATRSDSRLQVVPIIVVGSDFDEAAIVSFQHLNAFDILTVPAIDATVEAKVSRALLESRPTILVVDDEASMSNLIRSFLIRERFRVIVVASGEDALEVLADDRNNISVVVTDIVMPGISGLELLVQVKERLPDLPVILITGHATRFTPRMAIEAGADGYFAKPFHNKELIYTLRSVLDRSSRRKQTAFSSTR